MAAEVLSVPAWELAGFDFTGRPGEIPVCWRLWAIEYANVKGKQQRKMLQSIPGMG